VCETAILNSFALVVFLSLSLIDLAASSRSFSSACFCACSCACSCCLCAFFSAASASFAARFWEDAGGAADVDVVEESWPWSWSERASIVSL